MAILRAASSIEDSPWFDDGRQRLVLCLILAIWLHILFFFSWSRLGPELGQDLPDYDSPFVELSLEINQPLPEPETEAEPPSPAPAQASETFPEETISDLSPEELDFLSSEAEIIPHVPSPTPPTVDNTISVEETAPRFKSYNTTVRSLVGPHWVLPPEARSNFKPGRFTAVMTLDRQGQVLVIMIEESSGNPAMDYAAMEALRGAAPYPPFPDELAAFSQLNFRLHFDYRAIIRQAIPLD